VGFILAFLVAPAGIVVSAMGLSASKKAGVGNPLGTWGLWLSIVFTAFYVLAFVLPLILMFAGMPLLVSAHGLLSGAFPTGGMSV